MQLSMTFDAVAQDLSIKSPVMTEPMVVSQVTGLTLTIYTGDHLSIICKFVVGTFDLRAESG